MARTPCVVSHPSGTRGYNNHRNVHQQRSSVPHNAVVHTHQHQHQNHQHHHSVQHTTTVPTSPSHISSAGYEEEMPTDTRPCDHNCWTRSRRRRVLPGVRLRCLVCRALWVTLLQNHTKCPGFYSGSCKGDCGRPHILARGTVPKGMPQAQKAERLNTRSLKDLVVVPPVNGRRAKMAAFLPTKVHAGAGTAVLHTTAETECPTLQSSVPSSEDAKSGGDDAEVPEVTTQEGWFGSDEEVEEGSSVSSVSSGGAGSTTGIASSPSCYRHDPYSEKAVFVY